MILRLLHVGTAWPVFLGACGIGASVSVAAPVDRPTWTLAVEADRRAVLSYVEVAGGPRLLSFECGKEQGRFVMTIDGFPGLRPHFTEVRVSLTVEGLAFVRKGMMSSDPVSGRRVVKVDLSAEEDERRRIANDLLPVLTASGPGALIVADVVPHEILFGANERRAKGGSLLDTFARICFGVSSAAPAAGAPTPKR